MLRFREINFKKEESKNKSVQIRTTNPVSFKGHRVFKDEKGNNVYKFYYPGKSGNVNISLAILERDALGDYKVAREFKPKPLNSENSFEFNPKELGLDFDNADLAIGYRFNAPKKGIVLDNAVKTSGTNVYNIALHLNRETMEEPRQMLHIFPDAFNVPDKVKSRRTHFNLLGGSINSVIEKIPEIKKMGFKRIISTPVTGQDNLSSHGYWTTNPYQVTENFGSISDFKNLQLNLYKNGMGWISDGAFVNEGLEGIHIKDIMIWGKKSPYLDWLETHNIGDQSLRYGIMPKYKGPYKYIGIKLINAPYKIDFKKGANEEVVENYVSKNNDYNPNKPTFIQTFDSRLASLKQMNDTANQFRSYDNKNAADKNQINNYKDSILPYTFRVNPKEVEANYKKFANKNKKSENLMFRDYLVNWSNFEIAPSNKDGGVSLWVGNKDIAKLRFMIPEKAVKNRGYKVNSPEAKKMLAAQYQLQDNIVQVGKFWTSETARTLIEDTARKFSGKNPEKVIKELAGIEIPKSALKALEGNHNSPLNNLLKNKYNLKSIPVVQNILEGVMSYPLDAIEFAPDVSSVLGSPYMKKLANTEEEIALSRYEAFKKGNEYYLNIPQEYKNIYKKSDELFKNEIESRAEKIMKALDKSNPSLKLFDKKGLTNSGKEIYSLIAPDVTKFIIVSALAPSIKPRRNDKFLDYDTKELAQVSTDSLGLYNNASSPEDVAENLLLKLKKGIANINPKSETQFVEHLSKRVGKLDEKSIKVSKLIVDLTESGLEWRIDASKDVGDLEAVLAKEFTREECWNQIINFWGKFVDGVKTYNPRAYTIGELTHAKVYPDMTKSKRFSYSGAIENKFIDETRFTTQTNYSYFFMAPYMLYGSNTESCEHTPDLPSVISGKLFDGWGTPKNTWHNPGFLMSGPVDNVMFSHTFMGNHDKPRLLHMFALNTKKQIPHSKWNSDNAIESGDILREALRHSDRFKKLESDEKRSILNSIIACSTSKDESFNNAFANNSPVENLDLVIEKSEFLKESSVNISELKREVLSYILKPAMTEALENGFKGSKEFNNLDAKHKKIILSAIKTLEKGDYKYKNKGKIEDRQYDNDYFAARPIDINIDDVIEESILSSGDFEKFAEKNSKIVDKIKAEALKTILEPAMKKYKAAFALLVALPGNPTHFAGDELGETGFETKCKNEYQQNRNRLRWDRLKDENYSFIQDYRNEIISLTDLRNKKALSPLVNGHVVKLNNPPLRDENNMVIPGDNGKAISAFAMYRYNDKTDVISVFHNHGFSAAGNERNKSLPENDGDDIVTIDKIEIGENVDLKGHAIVYKNILDTTDTGRYVVKKDIKGSYIVRENEKHKQTPIKFKNAGLILARTKAFNGESLIESTKGEVSFLGRVNVNHNVQLANLRYQI